MPQQSTSLPLEAITLVLKELKGYFTFSTAHGDYIVVRKEDFDEMTLQANEQQLELPSRPTNEPDRVAEQANRDLAQVAVDDAEQFVDDLSIQASAQESIAVPEEGKKVRFEPLRGDLPPQLQD